MFSFHCRPEQDNYLKRVPQPQHSYSQMSPAALPRLEYSYCYHILCDDSVWCTKQVWLLIIDHLTLNDAIMINAKPCWNFYFYGVALAQWYRGLFWFICSGRFYNGYLSNKLFLVKCLEWGRAIFQNWWKFAILISLGGSNKNTIYWVASATFIFHSSAAWEVQNQGVGRSGVWRGPTSWFVDGCLLVSSHGEEQRERKQALPCLFLEEH